MVRTTRLFLLSLCRIPALKHNDKQDGMEGTEIVGINLEGFKFCIFSILVSSLLSVNRDQTSLQFLVLYFMVLVSIITSVSSQI
jgi:hypothetical protein